MYQAQVIVMHEQIRPIPNFQFDPAYKLLLVWSGNAT